VADGIVGVSVVGDLLRFVGEGLRAGIEHKGLEKPQVLWDKVSANRSSTEWAENLTLSYMALGVVLQVYPQLEALEVNARYEGDQLLSAIQHMLTSFHRNFDPSELLMLRVSKGEDGYKLESDETVSEFLFRNLETRFPHQVESWKHQLSEYFPNES